MSRTNYTPFSPWGEGLGMRGLAYQAAKQLHFLLYLQKPATLYIQVCGDKGHVGAHNMLLRLRVIR